jgi:hypothetical protein
MHGKLKVFIRFVVRVCPAIGHTLFAYLSPATTVMSKAGQSVSCRFTVCFLPVYSLSWVGLQSVFSRFTDCKLPLYRLSRKRRETVSRHVYPYLYFEMQKSFLTFVVTNISAAPTWKHRRIRRLAYKTLRIHVKESYLFKER